MGFEPTLFQSHNLVLYHTSIGHRGEYQIRTDDCTVLQTVAFDRSANSPNCSL